MKLILSFLALVLLTGSATAGPTEIASVPLLNISDTGIAKPNLMLLYDNSGSMRYAYTPDYINDSTTCRAGARMQDDVTRCTVGHPPFNSPDFNKQYYNPKVQYTPPVGADGKSFASLTASVTDDWKGVTIDGFGKNKTDLLGATDVATTNLASGFPDLKWCESSSSSKCGFNAATYSYPNDSKKSPRVYNTNPYYYTINVAEYCTNDNLTTCKTTAVGADAPTGYPIAAKVRWCKDDTLANCQAKYVGEYKYPRFSNQNGGVVASYGAITINASVGDHDMEITRVQVTERSGDVVITNGSVRASNGTNSSNEQIAVANALAASIIAKTGLANQYTACVRTPPKGSSVPACSTFGITLATNNMVAVIPIDCTAGATSKAMGPCSVVPDDSRDGWDITLTTPSVTAKSISYSIPVASTKLGAGAVVFVRTDIVATRNSYPKAPTRVDCAGATCTYAEEMTNFANWYGYYRTRNQMMKSAVGQAFRPIKGDRYNVGLVSLSAAAANGPMRRPLPFLGDDRTAWYEALYAMDGDQSTPIRQALHSVGKMYANQDPYIAAAGSEVVKYPCQQNFTFVTTDGYWNGNAAADVVSNDKVENLDRFCTRAKGCVDPAQQSYNSLADVALYWYNGGSNTELTSLRPTLEDWSKPGLVPAATGENKRLHMVTYALGLGVDGIMKYEPDYDNKPVPDGDFHKLVTGVKTGCPWNNNGAYVWPDPQTDKNSGSAAYQSRVDDLWHAAINGHGKYFSASDPLQVVDGLGQALSSIDVKSGAAAAAATSTPNISLHDNDIFSATFTTVHWFGELSDKKIDPGTGVVSTTATWNSSDLLGSKVAVDKDGRDGRKIVMLDTAANGGLKEFYYGNLSTEEQKWFDNKCSALAKCTKLLPDEQTVVNDGKNIVNWLRGQQQHADNVLMRAHAKTDDKYKVAGLPIVLGDIASSKPAYMRDPRKGYIFDDYDAFKTAEAARKATVFVAANDGMLHAFDAATGQELWAYVPRITMKKLHLQASTTYGLKHQFTVDGSPEVADVQIGGKWKTVLVAGLNGGGRGYYAIDVTKPDAPEKLWELCADATVCSGKNLDPDLGLTFGNPQIGTWKKAGTGAATWVVFLTSGYNNVPGTDEVSTGDGKGYLYVVDIATGEVLDKISTGAGDPATPSGFARITAISDNPSTDPLVTHVYGGDNQGHMWRFDFTTPGTHSVVMMGNAGEAQPITSRPDVTLCRVGTDPQKVVAFGTGRLLAVPDVSNTDLQSIYVLKDSATGIGNLRVATTMAKQSLAKVAGSDGNAYTISGTPVDLSKQQGWYVDLDQNAGERVNLDPMIVAGGLNVVTNLPKSSTACTVGGTSNVYQLNACTGRAIATTSSGVGDNGVGAIAGRTLVNNSAAVGFIVIRLPSGALKMITTTADGRTVTDPVLPSEATGARRAGWRRVRN